MRGKTVSQTNLSGNSVQAHSLVKGRAADSQQGRCLCQVPFRDGKSRLDLFYVSSFIFLQTLVYLLFPHGSETDSPVYWSRKELGVISFPLHINTAA